MNPHTFQSFGEQCMICGNGFYHPLHMASAEARMPKEATLTPKQGNPPSGRAREALRGSGYILPEEIVDPYALIEALTLRVRELNMDVLSLVADKAMLMGHLEQISLIEGEMDRSATRRVAALALSAIQKSKARSNIAAPALSQEP